MTGGPVRETGPPLTTWRVVRAIIAAAVVTSRGVTATGTV